MKKLILILFLGIFMIGFSSAYECYQETANVSTACGGYANGSYNTNPATWTNPTNIYDGNWSSYATSGGGTMIVNYTKPAKAVGAKIMYKSNAHFINSTIPWTCFSQVSNRVAINYNLGANLDVSCFDTESTSNGYVNTSSGGNQFYEDGMWWEMSDYAFNYNYTTYETSLEAYSLIITNSSTISSAYLNYSGTLTSASVSTSGTNSTITASKYFTSSDFGQHNFTFLVNYANGTTYKSSNFTQTVSPITFDLCNSSLTTKYLNITFINETNSLQRVGASLSATFYYSLSDIGSSNKTLNFINASENKEYDFCFSPQHKTVNIAGSLSYYNSESTTRSYNLDSTAMSNTTTKLSLYLLPTTAGIYSRYKTVTSGGNTISGVNAVIRRIISGTTYTIGTGTTDSSGQVIFFLNPDATYSYEFSKDGYATTSFSLNPNSIETYTVTMGSGVSTYNYTAIGTNLSYTITPSADNVTNNTAITFTFTVAGNNISLITMNLTNASGSQLYFGSNAGAGTISQSVNTGNNTEINGYFTISTGSETLVVTKKWIVYESFVGDYSLFKQLNIFKDYEFSKIFQILIMIATFIVLGILLASDKPFEDNSSQLAVFILLTWAFSIVGWLNTGIAPGTNALSEFSDQYGIAILTTILGVSIIFRREWT